MAAEVLTQSRGVGENTRLARGVRWRQACIAFSMDGFEQNNGSDWVGNVVELSLAATDVHTSVHLWLRNRNDIW